MKPSDAGSYQFGHFRENQTELDRLKRQASVTRDLETNLLKQAGLAPGMRVLDLACGPGLISCALAEICSPGEVLGVDISPELIEEARALQAKESIGNLSFQTGNVYELDLPQSSFDFVYARFLFQHLEFPERAVSNILRLLKPGGVFCAVDVDDEWLMLHPAPKEFSAFTQRAAEAQASHGGDRFVGRRLGQYLHGTGYRDVQTHVQVVTTHELGIKAFLDITTGFKKEQIGAEQQEFAEQALEDIYSVLEQPYAWGAVGVFVVTGRGA